MKTLLFLISLFLSTNAIGQKYTPAQIDSMVKLFTYSEEDIAPAFTGTNGTLIVFKHPTNLVNEKLEKNLKEHYKGAYTLLEVGEALNPKDTANSRFFVMVFERTNLGSGTGITTRSTEIEYSMMMTDRKTNKIYRYGLSTSCINCLFKKYFTTINKL